MFHSGPGLAEFGDNLNIFGCGCGGATVAVVDVVVVVLAAVHSTFVATSMLEIGSEK